MLFELIGDRTKSGLQYPPSGRGVFKRGTPTFHSDYMMDYVGNIKGLRVGVQGKGMFCRWRLRWEAQPHSRQSNQAEATSNACCSWQCPNAVLCSLEL